MPWPFSWFSGESALTKEQIKDTKVVIVGAGYGGTAVALALQKAGVPFVLVEPKKFFYHNIAALRAAVYPAFTDLTTVPLDESFGDSFRQASVSSIDVAGKAVTLDDGSRLEFTHLVLATGTTGSYPATTDLKTNEEIKNYNAEIAKDIDKAESIAIIGGGAVGCELAGEILDRYPKKKITLINSGDKLLSNVGLGDKLQDNTLKALEGKGVNVQLGQRVSNMDEIQFNKLAEQVVKTEKGDYKADLVFKAIGLKPNTNILRASLGDEKMDDQNRVKVTPQLLVEGLDKVYAIGDCCDWDQEKMAAHAQNHGEQVAANIKLELQGKDKKPYKPRFYGMIVPIGKNGGVGVYNGWCLPNFAIKSFKAKDLMTGMFWDYMGQKPPTVSLQ